MLLQERYKQHRHATSQFTIAGSAVPRFTLRPVQSTQARARPSSKHIVIFLGNETNRRKAPEEKGIRTTCLEERTAVFKRPIAMFLCIL